MYTLQASSRLIKSDYAIIQFKRYSLQNLITINIINKNTLKTIFHLCGRDSRNNARNYLQRNSALFPLSVEDRVKQRNTD